MDYINNRYNFFRLKTGRPITKYEPLNTVEQRALEKVQIDLTLKKEIKIPLCDIDIKSLTVARNIQIESTKAKVSDLMADYSDVLNGLTLKSLVDKDGNQLQEHYMLLNSNSVINFDSDGHVFFTFSNNSYSMCADQFFLDSIRKYMMEVFPDITKSPFKTQQCLDNVILAIYSEMCQKQTYNIPEALEVFKQKMTEVMNNPGKISSYNKQWQETSNKRRLNALNDQNNPYTLVCLNSGKFYQKYENWGIANALRFFAEEIGFTEKNYPGMENVLSNIIYELRAIEGMTDKERLEWFKNKMNEVINDKAKFNQYANHKMMFMSEVNTLIAEGATVEWGCENTSQKTITVKITHNGKTETATVRTDRESDVQALVKLGVLDKWRYFDYLSWDKLLSQNSKKNYSVDEVKTKVASWKISGINSYGYAYVGDWSEGYVFFTNQTALDVYRMLKENIRWSLSSLGYLSYYADEINNVMVYLWDKISYLLESGSEASCKEIVDAFKNALQEMLKDPEKLNEAKKYKEAEFFAAEHPQETETVANTVTQNGTEEQNEMFKNFVEIFGSSILSTLGINSVSDFVNKVLNYIGKDTLNYLLLLKQETDIDNSKMYNYLKDSYYTILIKANQSDDYTATMKLELKRLNSTFGYISATGLINNYNIPTEGYPNSSNKQKDWIINKREGNRFITENKATTNLANKLYCILRNRVNIVIENMELSNDDFDKIFIAAWNNCAGCFASAKNKIQEICNELVEILNNYTELYKVLDSSYPVSVSNQTFDEIQPISGKTYSYNTITFNGVYNYQNLINEFFDRNGDNYVLKDGYTIEQFYNYRTYIASQERKGQDSEKVDFKSQVYQKLSDIHPELTDLYTFDDITYNNWYNYPTLINQFFTFSGNNYVLKEGVTIDQYYNIRNYITELIKTNPQNIKNEQDAIDQINWVITIAYTGETKGCPIGASISSIRNCEPMTPDADICSKAFDNVINAIIQLQLYPYSAENIIIMLKALGAGDISCEYSKNAGTYNNHKKISTISFTFRGQKYEISAGDINQYEQKIVSNEYISDTLQGKQEYYNALIVNRDGYKYIKQIFDINDIQLLLKGRMELMDTYFEKLSNVKINGNETAATYVIKSPYKIEDIINNNVYPSNYIVQHNVNYSYEEYETDLLGYDYDFLGTIAGKTIGYQLGNNYDNTPADERIIFYDELLKGVNGTNTSSLINLFADYLKQEGLLSNDLISRYNNCLNEYNYRSSQRPWGYSYNKKFCEAFVALNNVSKEIEANIREAIKRLTGKNINEQSSLTSLDIMTALRNKYQNNDHNGLLQKANDYLVTQYSDLMTKVCDSNYKNRVFTGAQRCSDGSGNRVNSDISFVNDLYENLSKGEISVDEFVKKLKGYTVNVCNVYIENEWGFKVRYENRNIPGISNLVVTDKKIAFDIKTECKKDDIGDPIINPDGSYQFTIVHIEIPLF